MNPPPENILERISAETAIIIAMCVAVIATAGRIMQRRPAVPYAVAVGMCLSSCAASVTATLAAFEWANDVGRAGVIVIGITGGVLGMGLFEIAARLLIAVAERKVSITLEDSPKKK
ncbi:MAG: hypothetical protein HC933_10325 [Pleurocapsa sp. SU_196_0]|nr:hypothetical protein [Pleurocapsa sp. SU_196_0]